MDINLGFPEMLIIFGICLLLFGPRLLPVLGRGLERMIQESSDETHRVDQYMALILLLALVLLVVRLFQIFQ